MTEIKFRAMDKIKGEMLFFNLFGGDCDSIWIKLNNAQVMQFTGLLDKHGKEIYEGDIVKTYKKKKDGSLREIISPVVFHHGHFMLVKSKTNKKWMSLGCVENKDVLEIIGNIYENE